MTGNRETTQFLTNDDLLAGLQVEASALMCASVEAVLLHLFRSTTGKRERGIAFDVLHSKQLTVDQLREEQDRANVRLQWLLPAVVAVAVCCTVAPQFALWGQKLNTLP